MRLPCITLVATLLAQTASAAVLLDVREHTGFRGVTVKATGSINLAGLGTPEPLLWNRERDTLSNPHEGRLAAGIPALVADGAADVYFNVLAGVPAVLDFGPGTAPAFWTVASAGDAFVLYLLDNALILPTGYTSGARLHAITEYGRTTFAALGINQGKHGFDLANGERVNVNIAPIPLPPSAWLLLAGLGALAAAGFARRGAT